MIQKDLLEVSDTAHLKTVPKLKTKGTCMSVYCLTFCRAQEKMNNVKWIHCHRQLIANFVICYETSSQKKEEGGERDEGKRRRLLNKF